MRIHFGKAEEMKTEQPLVSVIITTYKRPDYLERAIDSVKSQTFRSLEIIVVDDNNAGTKYRRLTEQVMSKYAEEKSIKYIPHSENKNGAAARNTGIQHAQGNYITFLDDDDIYYPEKVEKQVNFLKNTKDFEGVYCGWLKEGKESWPKYQGDVTFELLSGLGLIITNSIMVTKESAIAIGGWDESFRRNQEAAFLLRFFKQGYKIGFVNELLFEMSSEDRSNVSNPRRMEEDFDYFLEVHRELIQKSAYEKGIDEAFVYSHRYRGVLINYLKYRNIRGAVKLYFRMVRKMPLRFNKDLFIYFIKKIQGKHVYE